MGRGEASRGIGEFRWSGSSWAGISAVTQDRRWETRASRIDTDSGTPRRAARRRSAGTPAQDRSPAFSQHAVQGRSPALSRHSAQDRSPAFSQRAAQGRSPTVSRRAIHLLVCSPNE
jgi:hypothetical protein